MKIFQDNEGNIYHEDDVMFLDVDDPGTQFLGYVTKASRAVTNCIDLMVQVLPLPPGRKPLPTNPWHQTVLSAWLSRVIAVAHEDRFGNLVTPEEFIHYHPAKAQRIYNRFSKIIDLYV